MTIERISQASTGKRRQHGRSAIDFVHRRNTTIDQRLRQYFDLGWEPSRSSEVLIALKEDIYCSIGKGMSWQHLVHTCDPEQIGTLKQVEEVSHFWVFCGQKKSVTTGAQPPQLWK
ncbi:unnamed protein product [Cuscuta europaea]|uniref:Uncharacterized protein n=1 Tax=Cuscuta europaea TaxID=41803 RepID=A0A9P0YWR4_CUSEU|nr:unnamed protein product [Cuscuta europaea]